MPAHLTKPIGLGALLLAVLALVSVPADAATVFVSLCAKAGTITPAWCPYPRANLEFCAATPDSCFEIISFHLLWLNATRLQRSCRARSSAGGDAWTYITAVDTRGYRHFLRA